jgi:integrase
MTKTPRQKITDTTVKKLPAPKAGNKITYDDEIAGFGVRVTAAGARSFILNYRTRTGRERRFTIGSCTNWKAAAARKEAELLKKRIDLGEDPLAQIEAGRDAKTVADLAHRFIEEHSKAKNRPSTLDGYERQIKNWILPKLKHIKVAELTFADVDGVHRYVTKSGHPYAANRVIALLSKMLNLSVRWGWRKDNPAKGIEKNHEEKREVYLTPDEVAGLAKALAEHHDRQAANVIRLLLLTGARKGEVLKARWDEIDLAAGVWTKRSAHTKQKKSHRVPLSAPARQLVAQLHEERGAESVWVFPSSRVEGQPREGIKRNWEEVRVAAGGKRIHDLRHTYASILASSGMSLPIIGALLGHTQSQTTLRYAHLYDDPLRAATERVGAIVDAGKKPAAEIVDITRGRA